MQTWPHHTSFHPGAPHAPPRRAADTGVLMSASNLAMACEIKPTVFIVDDDDAVRSAVSLLVRSCGWEPKAFASAEAFLASPIDDSPACLVLDLKMPTMDGVALQRELSQNGIELPVIIVTAYSDQSLAQRAVEGGAAAVISKPFNADELIETIKKTLSVSP